MNQPLVDIIVLNWNGGSDTAECLRSLSNLNYKNFNVIVVDNASHDDSVSIIEKTIDLLPRRSAKNHFKKVEVVTQDSALLRAEHDCSYTLLISPENGGFAAGNNHGVRFALTNQTCEYIWLLNNDVEVHPDALSALVRRSDHAVCAIGSVLVFHDTRDTVQCVGGVAFNIKRASGTQIGQGSRWYPQASYAEPRNMTYIAGASMLVKTETIRRGGLMDERYFLYFEEIDWAFQLQNEGKLAVATDSIVFHKEGASIGTSSRGKRSETSQYYLSRNLVLFYRKWHPLLMPVALMRNLRELTRSLFSMDFNMAFTIAVATYDALLGKSGRRL